MFCSHFHLIRVPGIRKGTILDNSMHMTDKRDTTVISQLQAVRRYHRLSRISMSQHGAFQADMIQLSFQLDQPLVTELTLILDRRFQQ